MDTLEQGRFLSNRIRWLLIGLLLLSTALYSVGISKERSAEGKITSTGKNLSAEQQEGHSEAGEAAGGTASESHVETGRAETLFGINLESPTFITVSIIAALLLILMLFLLPGVAVWLVLAFAALASIMDILELITQLGRGNLGIAGLAVLVLIAHLSLAVAAWIAVRRSRSAQRLLQPQ